MSCVCVCLSVCLSVTTLAATSFVFTLKSRYVGFCYRILTRGFSKKPSIRKLWREKANMQMSSYKSVQRVHRGRFSSLLGRVILMFPIVDRRYGSTLLVASSAASDSRRINTVYSLPTVYNTCIVYVVQVPIPYRTDSW